MVDNGSVERRSPSGRAVVAFVVCLAFSFAAYWDNVAQLPSWWERPEYSYGPIILPLALLIIAHRLSERVPVLAPSWWGIALLMLGVAMATVGNLAIFNSVSLWGFVVVLSGLVLAFWGRAAAKTAAAGLIYLFFAIPLPALLYTELSETLQSMSSTIGVALLDFSGFPVFQDGNVIDLGGYRLQVAEACSGLRYLFPLMSFGYLAGVLLRDRWWKRIVVFLSAIPITVGMNALRIAVIGMTVDWWGIGMAEGLLHDFEGWTVFIICIVLLMAESALLLRVGAGGRFLFEYLRWPRPPFLAGDRSRVGVPAMAALVLMATAAVAVNVGVLKARTEVVPEHRSLTAFPLQIGGWRGLPIAMPPDILDALRLTDYLLVDYRRGTGELAVNLYIAYYASQRFGSNVHSPSNCIPGGGWEIVRQQTRSVIVGGTVTRKLKVIEALIRRDQDTDLVYFWFDERGRQLIDDGEVKWYLFVDGLTLRRSDGALVRLVTPVSAGEAIDTAERRLDDFLKTAYPVVVAALPAGAAGEGFNGRGVSRP